MQEEILIFGDPGYFTEEFRESNLTLQLAQILKSYLLKATLTREHEFNLNISGRKEKIKDRNSLLISLHIGFDDDPNKNFLRIYYNAEKKESYYYACQIYNKLLNEFWQKGLNGVTITPINLKYFDSEAPEKILEATNFGIIIEIGNLNAPKNLLFEKKNLEGIAKAIKEALT